MEENYKDIFKKHFDNHQENIDPQIIWDNVKPKKKKRFFWLILNSLFALLAGFVLYLVFQNDKVLEQPVVAQNSDFAIEENLDDEATNLNQAKATGSLNGNNATDAGIIKPNKSRKELSKRTVPTFTEVKEKKKINQKLNIKEEGNPQLSSSESGDSKGHSEIVSTIGQASTNSNEVSTAELEQEAIESSIETIATNQVDACNKLTNLAIELFDIARALPILGNEILAYQPETSSETANYFSVGVNGAYGFLQVDRSVNETGSAQLLAARENTVEELEAARINLLTNFHLGPRISFSSGFQYTRLNELFTWQGSYERETAGQYATEIVQTQEETFTTYVEGEFEETVERNMRIYNKTHLVSIPFMVNLHHAVGAFSFSVGAGLEANVMKWRDGFVLDDSNIPIALQDQAQPTFDLNYVGKLGLEYNLLEDLSLGANFGYTQIMQKETNINTQFGIADLGMSLRYTMGK